jgi:ATP adenylyltransferase/5',5'''-P-1,P-4-tetraphosphate phosphorylase II
MDNKKKKDEVIVPESKYNPDYFIDDLTNILEMFAEKFKVIEHIEFDMKQKALISGLMIGFSSNFLVAYNKLATWGFLPKLPGQ